MDCCSHKYLLCYLQQQSGHSAGELLMSLCHQPAARRLSVVILKARNVPKMDITGFSGSLEAQVYCKKYS